MKRKVLVIGAHDDDPILGIGGRILQYLSSGDEVHIIICSDGRTSHRAVLGRKERPILHEVGNARKKEMAVAMKQMNIGNFEICSLPGEEGRVWQNIDLVEEILRKRIKEIGPDGLYYHLSDAHPDHRAISQITEKILLDVQLDIQVSEIFQFMIWTRELAEAQGQSNMDPSQAPEVPGNAIRFLLSESEKETKRRALHCMTSQVQIWPYPDWDPQPRPILDDKFLNYFLRGEEIFIPK